MKRSCSLPQVALSSPTTDDESIKVDQLQHGPSKTRVTPHRTYRGRFSLSRVHKGYRTEEQHRQRHCSSRTALGEANSLFEDGIYQCLLLQPDTQPTASGGANAQPPLLPLLSSVDGPDFHRRLQGIFTRSTSTKLSRFPEPSTIDRFRKHSRQVYLIGRNEHKYKLGHLLWLQLQAVIAGRPMHGAVQQETSSHDHDRYVVQCREREGVVLEDVLSFNANSAQCHTKLQLVAALLERYESFEALFPDSANMQKMHAVDRKVKERVTLLYMWYNTTTSLLACWREVRLILGMQDTDLTWPSLNDETDNTYTAFVSNSLQLKGMRRVLQRLQSVCANTVKRTVTHLHKPPSSYAEVVGAVDPLRNMPFAVHSYDNSLFDDLNSAHFRAEMTANAHCTVHHNELHVMGLPSFGGLFQRVVRVPVDLVQEWLKMPSSADVFTDALTLQAVIEDCHDRLEAAISVKHVYVLLSALAGRESDCVLNDLTEFEHHLGALFKSYLKCVRAWAQSEVRLEGDGAEGIERVVSTLLTEWARAKRYAISVICGESEVAHMFCVIGYDLLNRMVNEFLCDRETLLDECRSEFETTPHDTCSVQLRKQSSQIFVACRHFKSLVVQLRDRSSRALAFARGVLSDVEICALYRINPQHSPQLLYQLLTTAHSRVVLPKLADKWVVFCNKDAARNADLVQVLLNITCARNCTELPSHINAKLTCNEYLLIFAVQALPGVETWQVATVHVTLDADTEMALRYLQIPSELALIAVNGTVLPRVRVLLEDCLRPIVEVFEEQCSCHEIVSGHATALKEEAMKTCRLLWKNLAEEMADAVLDGRSLNTLGDIEVHSIRDTLLQAYNLAFEYHRDLYRVLCRAQHAQFAIETVAWVQQWHAFVKKLVHEGQGTGALPLWAVHSFQFLILAADPQLTAHLSAQLYQQLVNTIDSCVKHVIGDSSGSRCSSAASSVHETNASSTPHRVAMTRSQSVLDTNTRSLRIHTCVTELDCRRDDKLKQDEKIGHISQAHSTLSASTYLTPSKAPFDWRLLEKKIGSGRYGTVYVVMNLTHKSLLAMKQIRIERVNDSLRALVQEVDILRSLDHPNVVKYHAIEVHRQELLIFMEYCTEGTLESVCNEGRLDMLCVRRYTHFLLRGVEYIHKKMVVHRDIKPANIFLGKKDVLKLGDFGCSVRLQGGRTACGEIRDWRGTPAYMAPEVQTSGIVVQDGKDVVTGYGRAADVWSVGCVVLEMCTGKPPWHDLEMCQIVFKVGSGFRPTIPQHIESTDPACYSFLEQCFQAVPSQRATAQQLAQHPFSNIKVGQSVDSRSNFY